MACIYKITNKVDGKFYIGSTVNYPKRKNHHFNDLRKSVHHSIYMQRAFNKYGEENFSVEIIANCPREYLEKLEQWFVDNLNPSYNMARNVTRFALGRRLNEEQKRKISEFNKGNKYNLGRKARQETKDLMSSIRKGRKLKPESIEKLKHTGSKPILQYDLDNNFISEFISLSEASKFTYIGSTRISDCLRGNKESVGGFIWQYKYEKHKKGGQSFRGKKIIDTETNIVYKSISECAEKLNLTRSSLSFHLSGGYYSEYFKNLKYLHEFLQ